MLFHKMLRSPLHKLARALPIFCWLSTYNSEIALADLIAGITVGLTLISQSIVYAALADLPPQVISFMVKFIHLLYISTFKIIGIF